jgi:tight adherence protein C
MAEVIAGLLFLILMTVITYYGYRQYAKPQQALEQLGPFAKLTPKVDKIRGDESTGLAVQVFQQIGEKVPLSPEDAAQARRELMAAGYRSATSMAVYYGIRVVLTVLLVLVALSFREYVTSNPILRIVLVIAAGAVGFLGPMLFLEHLVDSRRETLRYSLPDALDLLVVCVEAGLGLDQAVQHVARELQITHSELCDELALVTLEIRAGKRRADALRNLGDRTGEPELRKLVATLIQTDRFGTSMAESLRTHSEFLRVRRRQEAEERANQVGVKLVFPVFFFILPAMFVVTAGPGVLQVFKYLFKTMREFH